MNSFTALLLLGALTVVASERFRRLVTPWNEKGEMPIGGACMSKVDVDKHNNDPTNSYKVGYHPCETGSICILRKCIDVDTLYRGRRPQQSVGEPQVFVIGGDKSSWTPAEFDSTEESDEDESEGNIPGGDSSSWAPGEGITIGDKSIRIPGEGITFGDKNIRIPGEGISFGDKRIRIPGEGLNFGDFSSGVRRVSIPGGDSSSWTPAYLRTKESRPVQLTKEYQVIRRQQVGEPKVFRRPVVIRTEEVGEPKVFRRPVVIRTEEVGEPKVFRRPVVIRTEEVGEPKVFRRPVVIRTEEVGEPNVFRRTEVTREYHSS